MGRLTLNQLSDLINGALMVATPGACYRHNASGDIYTVSQVVVREHDNEIMVAYARIDAPGIPFVRPLSEWVEHVPTNVGSAHCSNTRPRFQRVVKQETWVDA